MQIFATKILLTFILLGSDSSSADVKEAGAPNAEEHHQLRDEHNAALQKIAQLNTQLEKLQHVRDSAHKYVHVLICGGSGGAFQGSF